jgi:preprotein translocase subunit SecE
MTQENSHSPSLPESSKQPEKKSFFLTRFLRYVKESIGEFKKVVWPKKPDAIRMTVFVVIFVAIAAVFIYAVDMLISYLFNAILVRN